MSCRRIRWLEPTFAFREAALSPCSSYRVSQVTPGLSISNYSITVDQYSISRIFLGDSVAVMNRPLATGLPSTSAWAGARGPSYFHRMSSPFPGLNNTWPVTAVLNRKTVSSLEPTDTFLPNNYSNRANNIYSVNIKLKLLGGGRADIIPLRPCTSKYFALSRCRRLISRRHYHRRLHLLCDFVSSR